MNSTLDEWEIVRAVDELGDFAAAARHLNRSQSTISCTIAKLQEKLGIQIFTLTARKACLTKLGRVLRAQAEPHLTGFQQLEQEPDLWPRAANQRSGCRWTAFFRTIVSLPRWPSSAGDSHTFIPNFDRVL